MLLVYVIDTLKNNYTNVNSIIMFYPSFWVHLGTIDNHLLQCLNQQCDDQNCNWRIESGRVSAAAAAGGVCRLASWQLGGGWRLGGWRLGGWRLAIGLNIDSHADISTVWWVSRRWNGRCLHNQVVCLQFIDGLFYSNVTAWRRNVKYTVIST